MGRKPYEIRMVILNDSVLGIFHPLWTTQGKWLRENVFLIVIISRIYRGFCAKIVAFLQGKILDNNLNMDSLRNGFLGIKV